MKKTKYFCDRCGEEGFSRIRDADPLSYFRLTNTDGYDLHIDGLCQKCHGALVTFCKTFAEQRPGVVSWEDQ